MSDRKSTCIECGEPADVETGEFLFADLGLPVNVRGVEIVSCPACGAADPLIPNLKGLLRAVAAGVLETGRRLTGAEIRFLRKYNGLSAGEFAEKIGVDRHELSRYENGKRPVSESKDRLIRLVTIALAADLREHLGRTVEGFGPKRSGAPAIQPVGALDARTMEFRYLAA
jgi:transcriptional regulator with XRE-family HTH domain